MQRGGGNSCIKCTSKVNGNYYMKGTPKWYQDTVLKAWLEIVSPLRCSNSYTTNYFVILFGLNTIKGTAKASAVDFLRLNMLRGT